MSHHMMNVIFLAYFFLCVLPPYIQVISHLFFPRYQVRVTNGLPNNTIPLIILCQSYELEYHNRAVNEEFQWDFRLNFCGTTFFPPFLAGWER